MTDFYRELYDNLVKGIEECEKEHTNFRQHIECCFHICESTCLLINKQSASAAFRSAGEEIIFFKHIYPKFTSLVEFYSIVYRAELFLPDGPGDKIEFWKNELQRTEIFLKLHNDFRQYIKDDENFCDREYFLRTGKESPAQSNLIAQIIARELYGELLQKKLESAGNG